MRLHILNSPSSLSRCQSSLSNTDSLILIEDAVVLSASLLNGVGESNAVYVLNDDLLRRGIKPSSHIKSVDYAQFVDLCAAHTQCLSW